MTQLGHKIPFQGFQIASVASAVLLSYGIELLVATIRDPFSELVVGAANFLNRVGRFGASWLPDYHFSWLLTILLGVGGVLALLGGLCLGAWAKQQTRD